MGYQDILRNRQRERSSRPGAWSEILISDIQPDDDNDIALWRTNLMPQIRKFHGDANMVSIAGDLVDRGFPAMSEASTYYDYPELFEDFERLGWKREWLFTLSGNHDYNYGSPTDGPESRFYTEYLKYNPRLYYYTVQGNIVRIYMGDMYASGEGNITDYVLAWCESIIERHPRCCIILYMHQPVLGTLNITNLAVDNDQAQFGSQRIIDMLTRQTGKVALIVTGHNSWNLYGGATAPGVVSNEFKHGCWHVNVGLHIPSFKAYPAAPMSFCKMDFTQGSRRIRVRRWDCLNQQYVAAKEFSLTSPVPIELSNRLSYDGRFQYDERGGLMEVDDKLKIARRLHRTLNTGGTWTVDAKPQTMLAFYLQDRSGDDIPAGVGPAIDFNVPGGGGDEGALVALDSMGLGARIAAFKTSGTDVDYAAELKLFKSTSGKTDASLIPQTTLT